MKEEEADILIESLIREKIEGESIADKVCKVVEAHISNELNEFLSKYENDIVRACAKRKHYLNDECKDCEQFIRIEIIKVFKKKYTYENFDKVVRSVIKRKTIDFSKFRNNDIKGIINESNLNDGFDEDSKISLDDIS